MTGADYPVAVFNPGAIPSSAVPIVGTFGRILFACKATPAVAHAHVQHQLIIHLGGSPLDVSVDGRPLRLSAGQILLVQPWVRHEVQPGPEVGERASILLEPGWIQGAGLAALLASGNGHVVALLGSKLLVGLLELRRRAAMREHLDSLPELLHSLVASCVLPHVQGAQQQLRIIDRRLDIALSQIRTAPTGACSVSDLASAAGVSSAHLHRLFGELGCTPHQAVAACRLEWAIDGLAQPGREVQDIAFDLGFSTPGHFSRFFRNHVPLTPSSYRDSVVRI